MRKRLLGSVAALAAGAGLAFGAGRAAAQPPAAPPPAAAVAPNLPPATAALPPGALPPGTVFGPQGVAPPGFDPNGGLFGQIPAEGGFQLERAWLSFEYLLWKMRNGPLTQPLIVQGSPTGLVDPSFPGALPLFGGNGIRWDMSNGARVTLGAWLPGSTKVGLEASGTILETKPFTIVRDSGPLGIPVLGTPFINELTGTVDSLLATSEGNPGRIFASAKTQLYAVDLNLVGNVMRRLFFSCNVYGGFRHLALDEEIYMQYNSPTNPQGTFLGAADAGPIALEDRFRTQNYFYGPQLGFNFQYRYHRWTLDYDTRLAMGVMTRILDVTGFTDSDGVRAIGGLFAQTTNVGQRSDNEFGVVPQITGRLGYNISRCIRFTTGIDFMYVTSVLRPGNQIDPVVNPSLVPLRPEFGTAAGTARPTQLYNPTDFWALGVSFGLNFRY